MMLAEFLSGAIMMAFATVALFFIRFWFRTRDFLFAVFALSFLLLSLERWVLNFLNPMHEAKPMIYLIRMSAFFIIIVGVILKNRVTR